MNVPPRFLRNSRVAGCIPSVSTFRLSLVWPQPVALQRLNTGTRINSRIDGRPTIRISPDWPLEKNT